MVEQAGCLLLFFFGAQKILPQVIYFFPDCNHINITILAQTRHLNMPKVILSPQVCLLKPNLVHTITMPARPPPRTPPHRRPPLLLPRRRRAPMHQTNRPVRLPHRRTQLVYLVEVGNRQPEVVLGALLGLNRTHWCVHLLVLALRNVETTLRYHASLSC